MMSEMPDFLYVPPVEGVVFELRKRCYNQEKGGYKMENGEKRPIPGSSSEWNLDLPEGMDNSLVDENGKSWDNGYNFDEKADDDEEALGNPEKPEEAPEGPETAE